MYANIQNAYMGWWPELEGEGGFTMTNPSSSMELPMLLAPRTGCSQHSITIIVLLFSGHYVALTHFSGHRVPHSQLE